jgi:hypothetical protein
VAQAQAWAQALEQVVAEAKVAMVALWVVSGSAWAPARPRPQVAAVSAAAEEMGPAASPARVGPAAVEVLASAWRPVARARVAMLGAVAPVAAVASPCPACRNTGPAGRTTGGSAALSVPRPRLASTRHATAWQVRSAVFPPGRDQFPVRRAARLRQPLSRCQLARQAC